MRTLGRMRGKLSVHFKPARERPSGRYFSPAKSTQKPPGTQGQAAFTSLMPPFPRTPFLGPPPKPSGAKPGSPRKAGRLSRGEEPQQNERAFAFRRKRGIWRLRRRRLRRPTFQRGKVGKARHGATGAEGPVRAKRARFPLVPPFGDASGGGGVQLPTELESSYLPVRLFRVVTPLPEQRYPPRLVSGCNSMTLLNAAQGLCAVFQPVVEQPFY